MLEKIPKIQYQYWIIKRKGNFVENIKKQVKIHNYKLKNGEELRKLYYLLNI